MQSLFLITSIWSFRRELFFVSLAFLLILSFPIIAVFILTHTGMNVVSDKLVTVNVETQQIEILDPRNGSVVATIETAIDWPARGLVTLEFAQSSVYQSFHTGIDIAGKTGDPITPFMNGKVIYAGEIFWGYGKHIIIDHGNNVTSVYAHLDKVYVHKEQQVKRGDVIGTRGNTGWSTGPHLHFEIRVYGIPVNPRTFLGKSQVTL